MFLFLVAAISGTAHSCTDESAKILNALFDKVAVDLTNFEVKHAVPKTIGACSGLNPSLMPCKNVSKFPIDKKVKTDVSIHVDYVTGLNTLNMTNISFRCDNTTGLSNDERKYFIEVDGHFDNLDVPVHVHVDFPPLNPTIDANPKPLAFHAVGRIDCHDNSSFGIQLDPTTDSFSVSDVKVHYIIDIDVTSDIVNAVKDAVNTAEIKPKSKVLQGFTDLICKKKDASDAQTILV